MIILFNAVCCPSFNEQGRHIRRCFKTVIPLVLDKNDQASDQASDQV